ncbi:unnamed protein product [Paramecium octaurelia]|uniref:Uncharacterized protein n=1 Tax=Paramecium octaurelia TaxID=43137 RepID=A0A8S1YLF9_PAROT|nr:unnamed protein product [Paramecium octaurelia]
MSLSGIVSILLELLGLYQDGKRDEKEKDFEMHVLKDLEYLASTLDTISNIAFIFLFLTIFNCVKHRQHQNRQDGYRIIPYNEV